MLFGLPHFWRADDGKDGGAGDGENEDKDVTMKQSAFAQVIKERTTQAVEAETKKILKALGVEKFEDVAATLKEHKALKDANATELDKEKGKVTELTSKVTQLEADVEAANKKYRTEIVGQAVRKAAIKADVREDALDDFLKLVDLDKLEVDDDGKVKGADAAAKKALEGRDYMKKSSVTASTPRKPNTKKQDDEEANKRPALRL